MPGGWAAGLVPSHAAPGGPGVTGARAESARSPRVLGAVAGHQEEQEASERLSRLGLPLRFPHDALGPPLGGARPESPPPVGWPR